MSSIEVSHTGLLPSGVSVKVLLLFIPIKRLQLPVLSVCCSLINKSSGGHLHVLHENIQPSMVPCKQSTKETEWKKYRKSNQNTSEKNVSIVGEKKVAGSLFFTSITLSDDQGWGVTDVGRIHARKRYHIMDLCLFVCLCRLEVWRQK